MVQADPARPGEEEPQESQRVQRLVQLDELVEPGHRLHLHRQDRHDHVDEERDRGEPREQADEDEGAADQLGIPGQRGIERGKRNAPAGEALGHGVEVVDLAPARLEEEIADEEPGEELGNPLGPIELCQDALRSIDQRGGCHRRLLVMRRGEAGRRFTARASAGAR